MTTELTPHDLKCRDAIADAASYKGIAHFLRYFVMDSRPPKLIEKCDRWQLKIYAKLIPMVEHAAGNNPDYLGPKSAFISLCKGHDKTSMIGRLIMWCLAYGKLSKQSFKAVAAASDAGQADILWQQAKNEAAQNPWLNRRLQFLEGEIRSVENPNCKLLILNSDSGGASGHSPDFIYCDELAFWKKRDLWDVLRTAQGSKRKEAVMIVTTNAMLIGSWQHKIKTDAKADPSRWFVEDKPGHKASWISYEENKAKEGEVLPQFAKRMFEGVDTHPDEEGSYVSREQVEACINLPGPTERGDGHSLYCLSIDFGASNDRATAAVMHRNRDSRHIYLDRLWIHQGSKTIHTPGSLVRSWINEALEAYQIREFWADPHELETILSEYEGRVKIQRCNFAGEMHQTMAESLKTAIIDKTLHLYPNAGQLILKDGSTEDIVDEFAALITVAVGNRGRYRVDHRPLLHDDRYTSVAINVLGLVKLPNYPKEFNIEVIDMVDNNLQAKPATGFVPNAVESGEDAIFYSQVDNTHAVSVEPLVHTGKGARRVNLGNYSSIEQAKYAYYFAQKSLGRPVNLPELEIRDKERSEVEGKVMQKLQAAGQIKHEAVIEQAAATPPIVAQPVLGPPIKSKGGWTPKKRILAP